MQNNVFICIYLQIIVLYQPFLACILLILILEEQIKVMKGGSNESKKRFEKGRCHFP